MHIGSSFFLQVIDSLPMHAFRRGVARYDGNRYKKTFPCLDQYLRMTFAQLTHRESLRDIEVCLRAQKDKLYHRGIRGNVSRSAVADANERRDWRIQANLAQALTGASPFFAHPEMGFRPISGANNGATAIAFGGPHPSRRALRAAPGLPQ